MIFGISLLADCTSPSLIIEWPLKLSTIGREYVLRSTKMWVLPQSRARRIPLGTSESLVHTDQRLSDCPRLPPVHPISYPQPTKHSH